MKVVTAREIQEIDRKTIKEYGIRGPVLMERAGVATAKKILEIYCPSRVTVIAGTGNNGGDGLVVARELHNRGIKAHALILGNKAKLGPDCRLQHDIARKMGVSIEFGSALALRHVHGAVVVDALFGTGLNKAVAGKAAVVIAALNASQCTVVAVDIPSGISADTGRALGVAVRADATVTFGAPKRGHLLHPGAGHTGRLFVEDIGFPRNLFDDITCNLLTRENMSMLIPERPPYSHKGYYGHVLVVAGSRGKSGAARMTARACLMAGAGLVTIGAPEHLTGSFQAAVLEEMVLPLPDTGEGWISSQALGPILEFLNSHATVLAMGPGIGTSSDTASLVSQVVRACTSPLVLDADALSALQGNVEVLKEAKAPVVVTPHPGEFARMTGKSIDTIEGDRIGAALDFAERFGVVVVLKGAPTIVAEPEGHTFINSTGNPGMAKGGTGDVLTGMVASLLGQGLSPLEASLLGVHLHGYAGDLASCQKGLHSVMASDVINQIPEAMKSMGSSLA